MITIDGQKHYTIDELSRLTGLSVATLQQYTAPSKKYIQETMHNGVMCFSEAVVRKFMETHSFIKPPPQQGTRLPATTQTSTSQARTASSAKVDEETLMRKVLNACFAFLKQHHRTPGMKAMYEIEHNLRLFMFEAPDCFLRVAAEGSQVTVLTDDFLQLLENEKTMLKNELSEAKTQLSYVRTKRIEKTLEYEYTHPLIVVIEPHIDLGFLVWCREIPTFTACGKTEETALKAFHFTLMGYTRQLGACREDQLDEVQREHFKILGELLLPKAQKKGE